MWTNLHKGMSTVRKGAAKAAKMTKLGVVEKKGTPFLKKREGEDLLQLVCVIAIILFAMPRTEGKDISFHSEARRERRRKKRSTERVSSKSFTFFFSLFLYSKMGEREQAVCMRERGERVCSKVSFYTH